MKNFSYWESQNIWDQKRKQNIIIKENYVSKGSKAFYYTNIIITDVILVTKTTITLIFRSIFEHLHTT